MSVFNLVFGAADDLELEPVTVAISAPANDDLAQVLTGVVRDARRRRRARRHRRRGRRGHRSPSRSRTATRHRAASCRTASARPRAPGEPVTVEAVRGDEAGHRGRHRAVGGRRRSWTSSRPARSPPGPALAEGVAPADLAALVEQATSGGPAYDAHPGRGLRRAARRRCGAGGRAGGAVPALHRRASASRDCCSTASPARWRGCGRCRSAAGLIVASKALVSFILGVVATGVLLAVGGYLFDADFGSRARRWRSWCCA